MSASQQVSLDFSERLDVLKRGLFSEAFGCRDIRWSPDGKGLILLDKDMFCCCFEVEEEGPEAEVDPSL